MEVTAAAMACSTSEISAIQVVAILALIRHPRLVSSEPLMTPVRPRSSVMMSPGDNTTPTTEGTSTFNRDHLIGRQIRWWSGSICSRQAR